MKHLKRYNESLNNNETEELLDFCETSLAYLMDDGFEISCDDNKYINLYLPGKSPYGANPNAIKIKDPFDWNDIKDHFIPFLQLLSKRYELNRLFDINHKFKLESDYVVLFQGDRNMYATLEQVINDDLPTEVYHTLWCIVLKIRNKI
jgi:hypothetical protein